MAIQIHAAQRIRVMAASAPVKVKDAAKAILDIYNGKVKAPAALLKSPEPARAIAYHLGWKNLDGTKWWDDVMDIVADNDSNDEDSILKDFKSVGIETRPDGSGGWTCSKMNGAAAKKACDKLLKMGYKKQGNAMYPDDEGNFFLVKDGTEVCLDLDGAVYIN